MRILFLGRRYLYFRTFESVIRELASRGHDIHLAVEQEDLEGRPALVGALPASFRMSPAVMRRPVPTMIGTGSRAACGWVWTTCVTSTRCSTMHRS